MCATAFMPSAAQAAVTCNSTLTGTVGQSVIVPSGSTCKLDGARISGNVTVESGGILSAGTSRANTITGNVINHGGNVTLSCFTITGSLTSTGGSLNIPGGNRPTCARRVNGSVAISGGNPAYVLYASIGGRLSVTGSVNVPFIEGNRVAGNMTISGNAGSPQISANTVGGGLRCVANAAPPTTGGNSVGGARTGQCLGSS